MHENEVAKIIVDACYQIHTKLGPGLLEVVYEEVLFHELSRRGLSVKKQVPISVIWDTVMIEQGFRADLIVEDLVIIEIKSVEKLAPVHGKQLLTYLRLANKRLGILVNFSGFLLKSNIKRVVNGLEE
ncbi:MAG: GxxExxY protein [Anaerolineales bacterium]|nr:GxxExxY protein [Anaerolineales bacterium]